MIRLVTVPGGIELALPGQKISLTIDSPYFQPDAIPGTSSLPLDLPWTRENLRGLGFPHLRRGPGGPAPVVVDCYLDGVRWQRGKLVYLSVDAQAQRLRYHFVAAAADLATLIQGVQLPSLPLGTVPLVLDNSSPDYALLPVRNATFFGDKDKAPAGYPGYLNYVAPDGSRPASAPLAPQLYLVPLLRRVMARFGFTVSGPWVEDAEIQQLVLYADRVLPAGATTVVLARQAPAIDVADLLLGLQGQFCLGYFFDVARAELRITALQQVVAGASPRPRPGTWLTSTANSSTGFLLQLRPDTNDELDKTLNTGWQQLRIGAGGETQDIKAGTLHLVTAPDAGRTWLVPAYEAKGAVPGNVDVGDESRVGLRLLFNRGPQPDSAGNRYPLGSPLTQNLAGAAVGQYSLHVEGPQGLYARWHQAWLAFRARAVQHTYRSPFRIADLLQLDPSQAELVDFHLSLWEQVSLEFDASTRLSVATFTYQEVL